MIKKAVRVDIKPGIGPLLLCAFMFVVSTTSVYAREMIEHPQVKLQSLDKITARTMTFEADVGSTLRFGPLYIRVQKCMKSSPIDKPESAAFMQIWEVDPGAEPEWVFSGWMFSSSPALSAMDHPIYDVWVLDCLSDEVVQPEQPDTTEETETEKPEEAKAEPAQQEASGGKPVSTSEDTPEDAQ